MTDFPWARLPLARWPVARLSTLMKPAVRPVLVVQNELYHPLGVRSHGRGIFRKPSSLGSELGDSEFYWVEPGDFVFSGQFAWEGAVALVKHEHVGCVFTHRFPLYRTIQKRADERFLLYFFKTTLGRFLLEQNSYGAAGRNRPLNVRRLMKEKVPVPPLTVQKTIADFLDRKSAAIDTIIQKKATILGLVTERMSEIIARGHEPSVPLKRSDVEWLGSIPAHWDLMRARFLFRELSLPPRPEDKVVTAYRDGQVTLRENRRAEGYMFAVKETGYQHVRTGDLVIHSMDAFAGAVGVSESNGKCSPEYVICEPLDSTHVRSTLYYARLIREMAHKGYIFVICPSVRERAPRFRYSTFKDVVLTVPPINEQQQIEELLERERDFMLRTQESMQQLEEYRRSLISGAITGELDVRGEAA